MRKKIYCHYCSTKLIEKYTEGRLRLFCEQCNEPIYENPVPATCLVVVDSMERLLLVRRSVEPKKGFWCLPGGFVELGESPDLSALRELEEETGLSGEIFRLMGVTSGKSVRYGSVMMIGYLVKNYSGTLIAGDDASDADYFHFDNLPETAFESHMKFIRMYYET
ncbi:MAG: NUDIX hydrolase [Desulfobacteraceae bacterium]|nr:NUDIX hydrolase [Desulfobacteraceae bacterium]